MMALCLWTSEDGQAPCVEPRPKPSTWSVLRSPADRSESPPPSSTPTVSESALQGSGSTSVCASPSCTLAQAAVAPALVIGTTASSVTGGMGNASVTAARLDAARGLSDGGGSGSGSSGSGSGDGGLRTEALKVRTAGTRRGAGAIARKHSPSGLKRSRAEMEKGLSAGAAGVQGGVAGGIVGGGRRQGAVGKMEGSSWLNNTSQHGRLDASTPSQDSGGSGSGGDSGGGGGGGSGGAHKVASTRGRSGGKRRVSAPRRAGHQASVQNASLRGDGSASATAAAAAASAYPVPGSVAAKVEEICNGGTAEAGSGRNGYGGCWDSKGGGGGGSSHGTGGCWRRGAGNSRPLGKVVGVPLKVKARDVRILYDHCAFVGELEVSFDHVSWAWWTCPSSFYVYLFMWTNCS